MRAGQQAVAGARDVCLKPEEERSVYRILQLLRCSRFKDNITNAEGKDKRDLCFWWKNLRSSRKNKNQRKMNSNPRAQLDYCNSEGRKAQRSS